MPYTSIQDNSSVSLKAVKAHLHIDADDTASDFILKLYLNSAKEQADNYCQDTFASVPATVDLWVLKTVTLNYERRSALVVESDFKDLGKTQWTFNYDDYFHELKPYRREVGFGPLG